MKNSFLNIHIKKVLGVLFIICIQSNILCNKFTISDHTGAVYFNQQELVGYKRLDGTFWFLPSFKENVYVIKENTHYKIVSPKKYDPDLLYFLREHPRAYDALEKV